MEHQNEWREFMKLCLKFTSIEKLNLFFDLFFTIEEKNIFAARCLILKELLKDKHSQREISQTHHVSIAQITRGSNALKRIDSKTKKFLENNL